jgi:hypothetical protein
VRLHEREAITKPLSQSPKARGEVSFQRALEAIRHTRKTPKLIVRQGAAISFFRRGAGKPPIKDLQVGGEPRPLLLGFSRSLPGLRRGPFSPGRLLAPGPVLRLQVPDPRLQALQSASNPPKLLLETRDGAPPFALAPGFQAE